MRQLNQRRGIFLIKWISVEEKLPNAPYKNNNWSETVMIFDGQYIGIGYYESEYNIEDDPDAYEGQKELYSDACWHSDVDFVCPETITHWAEMPNKPYE